MIKEDIVKKNSGGDYKSYFLETYSSLTSWLRAERRLKPQPFFMAKKVFKEDIIEICIAPTLEFVEVLVPSVIAIVSMDGTHPLIQSEKLYMKK